MWRKVMGGHIWVTTYGSSPSPKVRWWSSKPMWSWQDGFDTWTSRTLRHSFSNPRNWGGCSQASSQLFENDDSNALNLQPPDTW